MGAGILPTTIMNGKVYFLFGKENKFEDYAPGFSDFGGGSDNSENLEETAIRESTEELTGFLGSQKDVRAMLKRCGTFTLDLMKDGKISYRVHIFPFDYNPWLTHYYNNNQQFLQKHLPSKVIKSTKIFEKAEIRWICVDELKRMRPQFRHFFRDLVDQMIQKKQEIKAFLQSCGKKQKTRRNRKQKKRSKSTRRH